MCIALCLPILTTTSLLAMGKVVATVSKVTANLRFFDKFSGNHHFTNTINFTI
jgi:hypothetical protein